MSGVNRLVPGDQQRIERTISDAGRRARDVDPSLADAFEAALRTHRRRAPSKNASLLDEIGRLETPDISSGNIFSTARSLDLLDYVIATVLPRLDVGEEVVSVARAMLEEEVARRYDVAARMDAEGQRHDP